MHELHEVGHTRQNWPTLIEYYPKLVTCPKCPLPAQGSLSSLLSRTSSFAENAACRPHQYKHLLYRSLVYFLNPAARDRVDTSAIISRSSGGGGTTTYSSGNGGKHAQLRFEAVRLSRLHVDASSGGGGSGSGGGGEAGESAPPSPTSFGGGRRLSRLWVGARRQSCRDGRSAPPSPTTDTHNKVRKGDVRILCFSWLRVEVLASSIC